MEEVDMFRICAWTVMWQSEKNINGDIGSYSIIFPVTSLFVYFFSSLKINISYFLLNTIIFPII